MEPIEIISKNAATKFKKNKKSNSPKNLNGSQSNKVNPKHKKKKVDHFNLMFKFKKR